MGITSSASTATVSPAPGRRWIVYAFTTTVLWGVWGALIELPERAGFPATLGYSVWAATMVPCALVALAGAGWRIRAGRAATAGAVLAGLLGAGGQLALFEALRHGPAYIVFPLVSLYPAVTVVLSVFVLRESASHRQWTGIALALPAVALLSYVLPGDGTVRGYGWLALAVAVLLMWGAQASVLKWANARMSAEAVFFYMAVTALLFVPVAIAMTDLSQPIELGLRGPYLAAAIHLLNAVGALALVYALRDGKAVVVAPLTALAPVITIALSLLIYSRVPAAYQLAGMALAVVAMYLLAES